MKLPGFTAETSAYTTSNIYHGVCGASSNVQQIESAACTCTRWSTPVCMDWKCPPQPHPACPVNKPKCCEPTLDGGCDKCVANNTNCSTP